MNYRSDIDGLRSIAVFLVIINHVGFSFFPGGFIGVDVFFVLSGFLITTIIAEKLKLGRFEFGAFFVRRIKRLLPASFFVIIVSALFFTWIMLPQDLVRFYQSIIWIVFYLGNFFFWKHHGGYFGGDAQEAPLLHTWSLAVEEQYYFIWPVIMAVSFKWFGIRKSIYFFLLMFIALAVISQWGTEITFGAAYYLLPTRFFELMAGSLLALVWPRLPKLGYSKSSVVSVLGLVLIFGSSSILTEHSQFPGYNALYPVLGTVLLIYSQGGLINKLLSMRGFVFTGKISYSMYLWHWPIIVFLRYMSVELTLIVQLLIIVLTYLVSVLTWRFIEQPFRESGDTEFRSVVLKMFLLPAVIISILVTIGIWNKGFPSRFEPAVLKMESALNSHPDIARAGCHSPLRYSSRLPQANCVEGDDDLKSLDLESAEVIIIGDSHANHFVPFMQKIAFDADKSILDYTLDQCIPVFDILWGQNSYKANKCHERNRIAREYIESSNLEFVVLAASWPGESTTKLFDPDRVVDVERKRNILMDRLDSMISFLEKKEIKVIILEDTPDLGGETPKCPIKKVVFDSELDCQVIRPVNVFISDIFENLQKKYPRIQVIKTRELFCKELICEMSLNGVPLYRDDDHLNLEGANQLGESYLELNSNPLL
ncbi:acyltransferase family protein, partial [Oleiphilus sp. HI0123]